MENDTKVIDKVVKTTNLHSIEIKDIYGKLDAIRKQLKDFIAAPVPPVPAKRHYKDVEIIDLCVFTVCLIGFCRFFGIK